jgi:hypothetical protein
MDGKMDGKLLSIIPKITKEGSKMELLRVSNEVAYYACSENYCKRIAQWRLIGEWKGTDETVIVEVCDVHLQDWEDCLNAPDKFYILTDTHIRLFPFTRLRDMGYELRL